MNTQTGYFKKALVVLMAVMMMFTMMPSMAWAGISEGNVEYANNSYFKEITFTTRESTEYDAVTFSDFANCKFVAPTNISSLCVKFQIREGIETEGIEFSAEYTDVKTKQLKNMPLQKTNEYYKLLNCISNNAEGATVNLFAKDSNGKIRQTIKVTISRAVAPMLFYINDSSRLNDFKRDVEGNFIYVLDVKEYVKELTLKVNQGNQIKAIMVGDAKATNMKPFRVTYAFNERGEMEIPVKFTPKNAQALESTYIIKCQASFDELLLASDSSGTALYNEIGKFSTATTTYNITVPSENDKIYLFGADKAHGKVHAKYIDTSGEEKEIDIKAFQFTELPDCIQFGSKEQNITVSLGNKEYTINIKRTPAPSGLSVKTIAGEELLIDDFSVLKKEYYAIVPSSERSIKINVEAGGEYHCTAFNKALELNKDNDYELSWEDGDCITLPIEVANESGETTTYTIKLLRGDGTNKPVLIKDITDNELRCKYEEFIEPIEIEAVGKRNGSISYTWYVNSEKDAAKGTGVVESRTKSIIIDTKKIEDSYYHCRITNTVNGKEYVTYTDVIHVYVDLGRSPNSIIKINPFSKEYFEGDVIQPLYVKAESEFSSIQNYSYQWYKAKTADKYEDAEPIDGANEQTYTPIIEEEGDHYFFCAVKNSYQQYPASEARTNIATIKIKSSADLGLNFQGDGTVNSPYVITGSDDLNKISNAVNQGYSFAGKYFKISDEVEEISLPTSWKPIGTVKDQESSIILSEGENRDKQYDYTGKGTKLFPFSGTFDGNNKTIVVAEGGLPLFGICREATIKNLNIYGKRIASNGLIHNYVVDYGIDGDYNTGCPATATIENVRLKEKSQTLRSGFLSGFASGANTVNIVNCEIEPGVVIGYDTSCEQAAIGSFAGEFNGTIYNSKSYATVNGKRQVGGLVGAKGQSMGPCTIANSQFIGRINASGDYAGGILGAGYYGAPNTPVPTVRNCLVAADIIGAKNVGGIYGGEPSCEDCWANGKGDITDNVFYGGLTATVANANVGGIIGFMKSYNKNQTMAENYYINTCGTAKGIGSVEISKVKDLDLSKEGTAVSQAALQDNSVVLKLNKSKTSFKNWIQGKEYPIHSSEPVVYEISLSGKYKTTYETGQKLVTDGVIITAKYSDGTTAKIDKDDKRFPDVKFTGFNSNKRGVQTITVTYGAATAAYEVTVLYPKATPITVFFTLLGDTAHGELTEATGKHTLKDKNLPETWVERTEVPITNNQTVYDVMKKVFEANAITWEESYGLGTAYIESLTRNGVTLGQFTNGSFSGWMYTLNGKHPSLGVAQQYLNGGEEIIFHYTDDYTIDISGENWDIPGGTVEEVKDVTTDTKSGTTTAPTEVKVSEKTNADGTKTKVADVKVSADNQKEILKQAKASKSKEIILNVSGKSVGDATKADVTLDKSFIDSIVKDTNAKLTIKTPFGDKTYTQEELKAMSEAATGSTVTVAIEKAAEEPTDDAAAKIAKAKSIVKDMKLVARSSKTAKKNIKAVLKSDAKVNASIKELKDLGFTVKYRFYRSTKKAASYKSTVTKKTASYTNTSGKKGTKYFYKVQVRVYDENGKLVAKTALKQCKYASRTWSKAR